jgi:Raf kinase inhibitor-like YbhB/YbcL family protein
MRLLPFVVLLAACNKTAGSPSPPPGVTPQAIAVTSPQIQAGAPIPPQYTCDGTGIMPPLAWTAPPDGTAGLVVIVDDPDAPGGVFTHLVAWNARPDSREIAEGAALSTIGATVGRNGFGKIGWTGPCPPRGTLHHYRFRVVAIDKALTLSEGAARGDVDTALAGRVIGDGTMTATFQH